MQTVSKWWVLWGLLTACAPAESPEAPTVQVPTVQRLARQLQREHLLESPLLAPAAEAVSETVFSEDFSSFEPEALGWPVTAAVAGEGPDGAGLTLSFANKKASHSLFIVPAQPNTAYRVSRRIWTTSPDIDLQVVELAATLEAGSDHRDWFAALATERFVRFRSVRQLHRYPEPPPEEAWSGGQLEFLTSPETHALVLRLDDARHVNSKSTSGVWLDDLRVERLAGDAGGLRAGRLAGEPVGPLGEVGLVRRGAPIISHDTGGAHVTQDTLYLPTPSTIEVPVTVSEGGELFFTYGPPPQSRPGEEGRLTISLDGVVLFDEAVGVEDETSRRWHRARLPLAAGQHTLTLQTRSPDGGLAHVVVGTMLLTAPRPERAPPNVVVVAIDTLRADRLSSYGAERRNSPNIDALAARGALFEQAIAPTNWTAASFASMFSGLYPSEHGVIYRTRSLPAEVHTLAERFAAAGWLTLGASYKAYLYGTRFDQGFDRWFNSPYPGARGADVLNVTRQWLAEHHQQPFFLFFHLNDPHQPFNHPAWYVGRRADSRVLDELGIVLPLNTHNPERWGEGAGTLRNPSPAMVKLSRDLYDEEVLYADHIVGGLLETLDVYGLTDNTIVAVVSDHGELLWERGRLGHGGADLNDPLVHVPLIIAPHSGAGLAPRQVSTQVPIIDLGPTLLELAGAPAEPYGHARSLLPLWSADTPRAPVISENVREEVVSVRMPPWKLVVEHGGRAPKAKFYDLVADPQERFPRPPPPAVRAEATGVLAEHMLSRWEGPFVVVTGELGTDREVRLRTEAGTTLEPLLGFSRKAGAWVAAGRGRWLGVARVVGPGAVLVDGAVPTPVARADAPPEGVGVVVVPGATARARSSSLSESAAREEALRAMGYLE